MSFLAPSLALLAAFMFGLAIHLQRSGLRTVDDLTGALVSVTATAAFYWAMSLFTMEWHWFATRTALMFAAVGLFFPASSQILQIISVQRLGPALTSAIGSFTPLWAVIPALIFLNETLSTLGALGVGLMVTGILMSAFAPKSFRSGWPIWTLALPLGASFLRGIVQPIVKSGYSEIPSPIFATLIMATVSGLVIFAFWTRPKAVLNRRATQAGLWWFVAAGVTNGIGIWAIFAAIQMADVSVVAPLGSTAPLFALFLGALVFRTERLRARHYIVVCLTVLGAILLVSQ